MLQGILFKSAKRNTDVFDTFSALLRTKTVGL